MALDQADNFVRGDVNASIGFEDTTISVIDAGKFPDPSTSNYNLVLWDAANYKRPDADPDVEIVRVSGRDTTNNNLTVSRGEEGTAGTSHPDTSILELTPTAKLVNDLNTHIGNSSAHHTKTATSDVTSANWGDYEIQKNGTDGSGIINFKT